jgi:hypothetical protein
MFGRKAHRQIPRTRQMPVIPGVLETSYVDS